MSRALGFVAVGLAIIFTAGAAAIGAGVAGSALSAGFAAGGLTTFFANIGLTFAISGLSQALVKRPGTPRPSMDVAYDGTVEPRRLWYGELVSAGMQVIGPWTSGTKNKDLHEIQALAGHKMNALTDVMFDEVTIPDADIAAVTGTNQDGKVTSGQFAGRAYVRRYLGLITQTADTILNNAFTSWNAGHRGRGVAYIAMKYVLDEKVYRGGKPNVRVKGQGKIFYDPRLDPTPGASPDNASYRVYSTNPMLCVVDYLLDTQLGCAIPPARIDWDLVVIGAGLCDEPVDIPGSTTQPRYTCNVQIYAAANDDERRENLATLLTAMLGHMYYRGGKYRIYAGSAQSPTFTLTESNVAGRISVETNTAANKKYNYVPGQFIDPQRDYKTMPFEPRSNAAYETEDGGRRPREVNFPCCTNQHEAQRNAMVILKRSRNMIEIEGVWDMACFKVRPGDVGELTLPEWDLEDFQVRCTSWRPLPDWKFEATFLQETANDWNDPEVGDYGATTAPVPPTPADVIPDDPEALVANPEVDGIRFTWAWLDSWPINVVQFHLYETTVGGAFSGATLVSPAISGVQYTLKKADTTARDYYLVAFNRYTDEESSEVGPVKAAALALTTGFHAQVSANTVYKELFEASSGNSGSVTLTPINGTGPFTYSWTAISGAGTTITANSASSATTTFNNTGMINGETNIRTFRGRITDATAATADEEVKVTYRRDDVTG